MLKSFNKKQVSVLPGLFRERMDTNRNYLMELDSQCLLQNFYLEAGIVMPGLQVVDDPDTANLHWGWEAPTCQLRGHFLGHWLSAAAALSANDNDIELKAKLDKIISELAKCQQLNGGEWIGSIPEKYFDNMAKKQQVWSPQYVMHKTIMGLTDAYKFTGNEQALEVVDKLANWYIHWTDEVKKYNPNAIYSGEQGAMLEAWAGLYELTKNEKYMKLVKCYWDNGWFSRLDDGKDVLSNDHANASIPLSHGSAKLYEVTGDEKWRTRTEEFWKCAVTDRGMYCTSGQNSGEFWVPPYSQGQFIGTSTQEFCTVYNMVRTADYLFKWTGDTQYADYIERCLYNGFLAQQNRITGTPAYFLPLKSGSRKKWGSKTHDFWCCHGTMVQAQTLYPDLIYFSNEDNNRILVSQYISSQLTFRKENADINISQTTDMKSYNSQVFFDEHSGGDMSRWSLKFNIESTEPKEFTLSLRVPCWVSGVPAVVINDQQIKELTIANGWLNITKEWSKDVLQILFPSESVMENLPDMPELTAIVDGPIVLAGLTASDCGIAGNFKKPEEFLCPQTEHTYGTFPWSQNCYVTRNQPKNIIFKPLYDITDETYTVYFTKK
ncbi:beta-L-arabinofuranosidase domain-containing protein [Robinsoniella peoriensis]|uniref:beta-L-arabinofuranosidase domain-containing protein n=1 Tax=Robinsoniella peoriensis TaxID=180332 RepID=UPI00085BE87D|nr:beta-L-arabinofuranosidase domain-containing protein [Robinsoniella peoriensis]